MTYYRLERMVFWHLTEIVKENMKIPNAHTTFPLTIESDEEEREGHYIIIEDLLSVSFTDKNGKINGLFIKTNDVASVRNIVERNEAYRLKAIFGRYPHHIRTATRKVAQLF